ncbi:hypothetical protein Metfor_0851 [Methanoregula formicica SMSP]|uniref:Uncharacterized protein n=1 Tax=Methanoregula formicica (strain DSM 22288 / NBRC 105244 / SMSP) TaxID=593750 RepID=L0HF11_METFS|nr:hypothetical protein Metfor_0851 [Methanoregula formicica SMSP]
MVFSGAFFVIPIVVSDSAYRYCFMNRDAKTGPSDPVVCFEGVDPAAGMQTGSVREPEHFRTGQAIKTMVFVIYCITKYNAYPRLFKILKTK